MKKIVFIAINLIHNTDFEKKSFNEQLMTLACTTLRSYKEAKRKHPDAYIIVGWREYGLCNQNSVNQDDINQFKQILTKLTQKKELLIIAGSLTSQKELNVKDNPDKIKKIEEAYNQYHFVERLEHVNNNSSFFSNSRNQFNLVKLNDYFANIRNTCYLFKEGAKVYTRHKIAPCKEIPKDAKEQNAYTFTEQPFLFTLDTSSSITIGIEICLEHSLGLLHHLVKDKGFKAPTIHIIIADSNNMVPEYACGDYTVRVDSDPNDSISFAINAKAKENFFYVYQCDPYQDNKPLLKEVYPAIYDFPEGSPQYGNFTKS